MPPEVLLPASAVLLAEEHRIAIAVSIYNDNITDKLCHGAVGALRDAGIPEDRILIAKVPGAWELPFATQRLLDSRNVLGVIALGAVIRGETSHDQHINRAVSMALMQLSLDHNKPVAFGLLTVQSLDQAIHRSGGHQGNKGEECARALLACLRLGSGLEKRWNGEPE
jgi:6,7-dimethyl-8-ribityllumazine synthase